MVTFYLKYATSILSSGTYNNTSDNVILSMWIWLYEVERENKSFPNKVTFKGLFSRGIYSKILLMTQDSHS